MLLITTNVARGFCTLVHSFLVVIILLHSVLRNTQTDRQTDNQITITLHLHSERINMPVAVLSCVQVSNTVKRKEVMNELHYQKFLT